MSYLGTTTYPIVTLPELVTESLGYQPVDANTVTQLNTTTGNYANSAYAAANTADQRAVTSGVYANSAFATANSKTSNVGTVTSVGGTGTVNGLTLTGTVTTSGNLTLGGTLDLSSPPAIGGTSSSSGSFTSLTDSGNLTFTGTGNRIRGDFSNATVASRVMFQTSTANSSTSIYIIPNGTGTTSQFVAVNNSDPTNASVLQLLAQSTDIQLRSGLTGSGTYLPMTFYTGGSEAMRIDTSRNVLIGGTQTGSKFNIEASSSANTVIASPSIILQNRNSTSGTFLLGGLFGNAYRDVSTKQNCVGVWLEAQNGAGAGAAAKQGAVVFGAMDTAGLTAGIEWNIPTERMRIDSSGNVGIGVVPSAWNSGWKALQIGSRSVITSGTGTVTDVQYNVYRNASNNDVYIDSDFATRYRQISGGHYWSTAASGTAGATVAFGDAKMILDSSGNLGIGTTNAAPANGKGMSINGGSITRIDLRTSTSGDASGDGTSLQLNGNDFTIENRETGFVAIATSLQERMRINADGRLLFRTTTLPASSWNTNSLVNIQAGVQLTHTGNAAIWRQLSWSGDTSDTALFFPNQAGNVPFLSSAGAWTNASDGRLKTNVRDIEHGLASVMAAQPRSYTRIDCAGNYIGFVAQELKEIISEVVLGSEETQYGVDYGSLVAVAFKAIQEQQSMIEEMRVEIQLLKTQ